MCFDKLQTKIVEDDKNTDDWSLESLQILERKNAYSLIENALAEGERSEKETMLRLVSNKNVEFYVLHWTAPSNYGSTIMALNKLTCDEIGSILYWSQE